MGFRKPLVLELTGDLSPLDVYRLFREEVHSFWLDSGMDPWKLGRFSFIGYNPFLVFKSKGNKVNIFEGYPSQNLQTRVGNPLELLREALARYRTERHPIVPFCGGAVGYFAYDLGWQLERLPSLALDDLQLPDCYLGFYDSVIVFDHLLGKVYLCATGFPETDEAKAERLAEQRLRQIKQRLSSNPKTNPVSHLAFIASPMAEKHAGSRWPWSGYDLKDASPSAIASNFTKEGYCLAIKRAKEYIAAGDIYQVNLSQRFSVESPGDPFEIYCRLRQINPAPFAAFLNFEDVVVVSASPERFLKVRDGIVETLPIKGTRPRGKDPASDRALRAELLSSEKDRAELVMIVDLERNDLGRVCEFGSVKVTELFHLEEYATVFHLVSTVQGRLAKGKDVIDLLKAGFPGGSITGAPKIRAMEIIEELEPVKRGIYTGSIGYISFAGDMDLNIVIRTLIIKGRRGYLQVGGGIVADSDPEKEYQETLDKAQALFRALALHPPE